MKLRWKLMLAFTLCIISFVMLTQGMNNSVLNVRSREEKETLYGALAKQTLVSFELLSDDIEYGFFESVTNAQLSEYLLSDTVVQGTIRLQLNLQLHQICSNSQYIYAILLLDDQGNRYYATDDLAGPPIGDSLEALIDRQFFNTQQETVWLCDDSGMLYLKRVARKIYPQQDVGVVVAVLDSDYIQSMIGLGQMADGFIAVLNRAGTPIMISDRAYSPALNAILESGPTNQEGNIRLNSQDYYFTICASDDREWILVAAVPHSVMFHTVRDVTSQTLVLGFCAIVMGILLSLVLSWQLTRSIHVLLEHMNKISDGDINVTIPETGSQEISHIAHSVNWMMEKLRESIRQKIQEATEKQQAKYEMLELKYRSLQAQVSPHFLNNILSAISAVAEVGDCRKAGQLALLAGRYLREHLQRNDRKYATVEEEMRTVRGYVRLYRAVFSVRFTLVLKADEEVMKARMPNMLLQPLVENALIHGLSHADKKRYQISVLARKDGDRLLITVSDNGCGLSKQVLEEMLSLADGDPLPQRHTGYGSKNVILRLRILYADRSRLIISSDKDVGTAISIDLPLETETGKPASDVSKLFAKSRKGTEDRTNVLPE